MKSKWPDKMALKLANQLFRLQRSFAQVMSITTCRLSTKQIKILLILFCVTWSALSFLFIGQAIFYKTNNNKIDIDPIYMPQHSIKTGEPLHPSYDTLKIIQQ
jgi:hypothetical protein